MVNRRIACLTGLLALSAAAQPVAAAPRANPMIGRFDIAGVKLGTGLGEALTLIAQTFAAEDLTEVTPTSTQTYTADPAPPGSVVRLSITVAASRSPSAAHYANDRFVLLVAGAATDERIIGITRDYLSPTGLDRAEVLRNLFRKYGQPADQMTPPASIGTASSTMTWMFGPGGGMTGGGSQGMTAGLCAAGLFQFQDYFENASAGEHEDMMDLLHQQSGLGCGLVMQASFAYDAVHYALYDTGLAQAVLTQAAGAKTAKAKAPAVDTAAVAAAAAIKY